MLQELKMNFSFPSLQQIWTSSWHSLRLATTPFLQMWQASFGCWVLDLHWVNIKRNWEVSHKIPKDFKSRCIKGFASNNHAPRKFGYITQGCKKDSSEGSNCLHIQGEKKTWVLVEYLQQIGVQRKHIGGFLVRRPILFDSDVEKDFGSNWWLPQEHKC